MLYLAPKFYGEQKIEASNIIFEGETLDLLNCGNLWLTDCVFPEWEGLIMREDSNLNCMRCQFNGPGDTTWSAIDVEGRSNLSVTDCTFNRCGGVEGNPCIRLTDDTENVSLKLIGNTFKNLNTSPIGGDYGERIQVNGQAILKNNSYNT